MVVKLGDLEDNPSLKSLNNFDCPCILSCATYIEMVTNNNYLSLLTDLN